MMDTWDSKAAVAAINGVAEAVPEGPPPPRSVSLPHTTLRRLMRLHARVEGAMSVFQQAQVAAQQQQMALRDALAEALEEEGVNAAAIGDAQLQINWRTGEVTLP